MARQRHDLGWQKRQKGRKRLPKLRQAYERAKRNSPTPLPDFSTWVEKRR